MSKSKVAVTIETQLLSRLDRLVAEQRFPNRSRAFEEAVEEKLNRVDRSRLARECAKLDATLEQQLADEGLSKDLAEWPEY